MKRELTDSELAKAVRNPFYHKLCKEVTVGIRNKDYDLFEKIAKDNDETIESTIRRCLRVHADMLREDEEN